MASRIKLCAFISVAGIVGVLVLILGGQQLAYDEPWYLGTVPQLAEHGFTKKFLLELPGPPGPLYTVIHYALEPLTNLALPGIRFVSLTFLIASVWVLAKILMVRGAQMAVAKALTVLSIPTLLVVSGMALTDVLSMFFYLLQIYLLFLCFEEKETKKSIVYALLAGLFFGFCVIGRQSYLVTLAAVAPVFVLRQDKRGAIALFVLSGVLLPLLHFVVWEGLIPPKARVVIPPSFNPLYTMIGFGYAGIVQFLFNPSFLHSQWRRFIGVTFAISTLFYGSYLLGFLPGDKITAFGESFVRAFLPESLLRLYGAVAFGALLAVALFFAAHLAKKVWGSLYRDPKMVVLYLNIIVLLLVTGGMGHFFSFRYVLAPSVLLVVTEIDDLSFTRWKIARVATGVGAGLYMLSGYVA